MKLRWLVAAAAGGAIFYLADEFAQRVEQLEHQFDAIDYDGLQKWSIEINEKLAALDPAVLAERVLDRFVEARLLARQRAGAPDVGGRGFPKPQGDPRAEPQ